MKTCCGYTEAVEPEVEESADTCCMMTRDDVVAGTVISSEMTDLRNKVTKYETALLDLKEMWESGRIMGVSDMNRVLSALSNP